MKSTNAITLHLLFMFAIPQIQGAEDGYLRYIKDGCFVRNEALSCLKYRALKISINAIFGDDNGNETTTNNNVLSLVPLEPDTIEKLGINTEEVAVIEPKSLLSEWAELTKYVVKTVRDFFKLKGVKFNLPDGARTVEVDETDGRGKKRRLAMIVPLLTLLTAFKTKLLLVPILLGVMLIKKLLLAAALFLPSLLSTLKQCKHHVPHYSYFGGSESDFNTDYSNSYAYSSGGGYNKDWASNRAYMPKHRPTPAPVYITAPGNAS